MQHDFTHKYKEAMKTVKIQNGQAELTHEEAVRELKSLTSILKLSLQEHIDYHNVIDFVAAGNNSQHKGVYNVINPEQFGEAAS